MRNSIKYMVLYFGLVALLVSMTIQLASAQEITPPPQLEEKQQYVSISQQQLDQILAPIALYPDTLLSHILIASTYPLEVIQAARWRGENSDLDQQQALDAVEEKDWDPSVKALAPFEDLLQTLTEDLDWLENLGDAFLVDEEAVLSRVQALRQKAYEAGTLNSNQYLEVETEQDQIIIQPVEKEVVYVPYYDTRVVYGPWWHDSLPYYWSHPSNYLLYGGFYWSNRVVIHPSFYFGGFHWPNRHIIVDYHWRQTHRHYNYHSPRKIVRNHEYQRWQHNPEHRKGARYHHNSAVLNGHNKMRPVKVIRNTEVRSSNSAHSPQAKGQRKASKQTKLQSVEKAHKPEERYQQRTAEIKQQLQQQPSHQPKSSSYDNREAVKKRDIKVRKQERGRSDDRKSHATQKSATTKSVTVANDYNRDMYRRASPRNETSPNTKTYQKPQTPSYKQKTYRQKSVESTNNTSRQISRKQRHASPAKGSMHKEKHKQR